MDEILVTALALAVASVLAVLWFKPSWVLPDDDEEPEEKLALLLEKSLFAPPKPAPEPEVPDYVRQILTLGSPTAGHLLAKELTRRLRYTLCVTWDQETETLRVGIFSIELEEGDTEHSLVVYIKTECVSGPRPVISRGIFTNKTMPDGVLVATGASVFTPKTVPAHGVEIGNVSDGLEVDVREVNDILDVVKC